MRSDDAVVANGDSSLLAATLLAPSALLATLALSAPVKIILGWSSVPSLVVATLLASAVAVAVLRLERPRWRSSPRLLVGLLCAAVLIGALTVRLLYNPYVFGMINTVYQPDAGTHVAYTYSFGASAGGEAPYGGFVAFHMAAYWLATIFRLAPFADFRLVYYLSVLAWPLALVALAALITPDRASAFAVAVALTLFAAPMAFDIVVPIFGALQALAAYPEMFGFIPLFLCWAAYAGCRSPVSRLLCVGICVFVLRYTYGLNVGDLLATLAVLALVEATELRGPLKRISALLIAIGLAVVAHTVYARLWPLRLQDGPRPQSELVPMASASAQLIGAIALLALPALLDIQRSPTVARLLRFAGLFAAVTGFVQLVYLDHGNYPAYYFYRYQLYGPVIVASGLVLAAVAAILRLRSSRLQGCIALAITVVSSAFVLSYNDEGILHYRGMAWERAYGKPPFGWFVPLFDADAAQRIAQVLRQHKKKFGGIFSNPLPYAFFLDQQFHGPGLHWWQFLHDPNYTPGGRSLSEPGYCFFWDRPAESFRQKDLPWAWQIEKLEQRADRSCFAYTPRYRPDSVARICAVCN